jgi:hypothetical protein
MFRRTFDVSRLTFDVSPFTIDHSRIPDVSRPAICNHTTLNQFPLKKYHLIALALLISTLAFGQRKKATIDIKEVTRIEKILSADSMEGRQAGKPGADKAARFIAEEFRKIGLQLPDGQSSYLQRFRMVAPQTTAVSGNFGETALNAQDVIVFTPQEALTISQDSGYKKVFIKAGSNLGQELSKYLPATENVLVLVDTSFRNRFSRINRLKGLMFENTKSVVFLLSSHDAATYQINATHQVPKVELSNVVGILPGKSKKNEYVIFSGHYDHLGIGAPVEQDSIFNGANDDATGVTAVIMLAKYFKALGNNERTIIFSAFTAEESGGFGSQYFSRQFDPAKVVAMFNIEMIGTESKWGKRSAFITGFNETDMGKMLQRNLAGSGFTFHPDPYPDLDLFYRSDNATLARLGVPAHTISTSKMDKEQFYHTVNDEFETLDMENMAKIIEAIARSSASIVNGKEAPSRVNVETLK